MDLFFSIALIATSLILIVLVLLQYGKEKNLSGAIAGGSDNFFGKAQKRKKDRVLSISTLVVSIVFALLVIAAYCLVS